MTIGVECPHCENRFQFDRKLLGKTVKCPGGTCGEPFVVAESPAVEIYDAEIVEPAKPAKPTKAKPMPKAAALPGPKEVKWDEAADPLPPLPGGKPAKAETPKKPASRDDTTDIPIRTRKKKNSLPLLIAVGLGVLLIVAIGATSLVLFASGWKSEEKDAIEAEASYKDGKYADARKRYEQLQTDYLRSTTGPRYKFFAALAGLQASVSVVTVKENPTPAVDALDAFLKEHGESPFAQPNSGFGVDIVQAGQKLGLAIAEHADARLKAYRADRAKGEELKKAEASLRVGRELIPKLEPFRDKSSAAFDDIRAKYDATDAAIRGEYERQARIEPWRILPEDPTDAKIAEYEKAMKAAGLADDAEVKDLANAAKGALRKLVKFDSDPEPALAGPRDRLGGLAIVSRPRLSPTPLPQADDAGDVVWTVARGQLFVLDAATGTRLWSERVATDPSAKQAPVPLRVTFPDGQNDWLLVPSLLDGEAAITARRVRTGEAIWHQTASAPILGAPVRIGSKLFLGLKDEKGSIVQLDIATGDRIDQGSIRQPIGGGLAAMKGTRAGHGYLFVPGDARRIFAFEIGKEDDAGRRLPPKPCRVFATDHPTDSLAGEPLVIAPDLPNAPRRLILAQRDGPQGIKIRSLNLPSLNELAEPVDGETKVEGNEESVSGWATFPPISDGERVAVATDTGSFALFGLNQPGNADRPIFELPGRKVAIDAATVSRGLVVAAEEDGYWVVQAETLVRMRVKLDPATGYKVVPQENPVPLGEPIARAQLVPSANLGVVTVKSSLQPAVQMVAFDLESGDVVWRRQLGAVAVAQPVPLGENAWIVVDEGGGVHKLTRNPVDDVLKAEALADPVEAMMAPATMAHAGPHLWSLIGVPSKEGNKLLIRRFRDGKKMQEVEVLVPGLVRGQPCALGESLLVPLSNGLIYRLAPDSPELAQGPTWKGANASPDSLCYLVPLGGEEFLATEADGKTIRKWKWPAKAEKAEKGASWESSETLTCPPIWIENAGKPLLLTGDAAGASLFDPARVTSESIRRWKGTKDGVLLPGKATLLRAAGDRVLACIEGKAVAAIDPSKDGTAWVVPEPANAEVGDVIGLEPAGDGVLLTYQSGLVREVNLAKGTVVAEAARTLGAPFVATAAVPAGKTLLLIPSSDGSFGFGSLNK